MPHIFKLLPLLALVVAACGSDDSAGSDEDSSVSDGLVEITGNVTYLQRIALEPGGAATVALEDISLADAEAPVVAEETIELGDQQVPIAFELIVDQADLEEGASYNVRASIAGPDGDLQWTTDTITPYVSGDGSVDVGDLVLVQVVASDAEEGATPLTGAWNVTEIDGEPVVSGSAPTLEFGSDGVLSGNASCNQFTTAFTLDGDALQLDPIAVTAMACLEEDVAVQEAAFLGVLDDSPTYQLADANQLLIIESASGSTVTARR